MKALIEFVTEYMPLRMYICVIVCVVSAFLMFCEMMGYEKNVWQGSAEVTSIEAGDENQIVLKLKSVDGSYAGVIKSHDNRVVLDYFHGVKVFSCAATELGGTDCWVQKKK
jgi:hypothetical protein